MLFEDYLPLFSFFLLRKHGLLKKCMWVGEPAVSRKASWPEGTLGQTHKTPMGGAAEDINER